MNYHFFASEADKLQLFNFLFSETDFQVFDSYSFYGQSIRQYKKVSDLASTFDLAAGNQFAISLTLWSPKFSGTVKFLKVNLNPKYCNGYNFRYRTAGWGIIQLHLGGEQDNTLYYSTLAHFSEKEAKAHEEIPLTLKSMKVSNWNWPEINRIGRQLKYVIHQRLAVEKIGGIGILPEAAERQRQGIILHC